MFQEFPDDNMNDNFLSERRQKIAEQSIMNMEERKNDLKRSKSVFIGAVSGMALAGVVGWFALSPRYAAENVGEIPVIRRTQAAVKVLPSDPGGMEILNQDKTVYDIIDNQESAPAVESILPPPEQPKLPVIQPEPAPQPAAGAAQSAVIEPERVVGTANVGAGKDSRVGKSGSVAAGVNEEPEIKLPTIKEAAERRNAQAAKNAAPVPAVSASTAAVLDNISKGASREEPEEKAAPAPTVADKGSWQIQLMSSPNKKAVEAAWNNMVKKHPALKGQPHEVETADLGGKGTYYRLKAGAFADRSGADNLCNAVKKQGGSCIVKKK